MNYIQFDAVGALTDAEGVRLPGWHVITTAPVVEWGAYRVQPENPAQVYAGVVTYFYVFADKEAFDAAVASVNLALPEKAAGTRITRLAFLNRFTDAEAITIDLASQGLTVQAASMRRYTNKINAAQYVDLQRSETRGGVFALEAAGILAVGRATEILDAEIQDHERWNG